MIDAETGDKLRCGCLRIQADDPLRQGTGRRLKHSLANAKQ